MAEIVALADRLDGIMRTAEALLGAGRAVDLAGLEAGTGRLCAGCLDLPPVLGRGLRDRLGALLARLDLLEAAVRGAGSGPDPRPGAGG